MHVSLDESLYNVAEEEILESQFSAEFRPRSFGTNYLTTAQATKKLFDCSNINLPNARTNEFFGFCVDIVALRSVTGHKQLDQILKQLGEHSIPRENSQNSFRFGDVTLKSTGTIEIGLRMLSPE